MFVDFWSSLFVEGRVDREGWAWALLSEIGVMLVVTARMSMVRL